MKHILIKTILILAVLTLGAYLLMPAFQLMAQETEPTPAGQTSQSMSAEEVDSHLAGMSDESINGGEVSEFVPGPFHVVF